MDFLCFLKRFSSFVWVSFLPDGVKNIFKTLSSTVCIELMAFSISSFYVGVAGAMALSLWLGSVETAEAFDINVSFQVLFMIIIGGLGSMMGSFVGAAFIILMPIVLTNVMVGSLGMQAVTAKHFEFMVFGGLIIFFLIVEPHGIARLWQIAKEKLRMWPFPH